ncbi:uncharacterized protein MELLADRAFT_65109 [Melampsora larici-populina 98AG31]|uniref:F-box domain-containing protein n=1 Tax=Melampsora larici-populina (strain 98AG31 / pathotype 3-4-7) TaxID=747676 RepID=F4RU11_MELLP|nr:uncharacterized protein MELLADRAFT_65109 [Melampsora larici-populina 98AG31]EGG04166.1 hypothetical protein MELLADRAFT_65109 [Melampsora larici-populina 98AG31]
MPPSSRKAQLNLWREIASKRHEGTTPVEPHLDFIQSRFEELDSEGFIWSKDSILGIFLQLGLPEGPHSSFSSVNEILQSRALLGSETSSHEVKELIQTEELRRRSHPRGLMNLPIEIFNKILEALDDLSRNESYALAFQKRKGIAVISGSGNKQPYKTYLPQKSPILNTIQTFSLACPEVYQLCRPWLWRKLEFPTRLPAPIDIWTEDIILRQGSLVRSLTLHLSQNCSQPDGVVDRDPFYDNLTVDMEHGDPERVSPKNAKNLINRSPNLSELKIDYIHRRRSDDSLGVSAFLSELVPLITSLKHLRQLSLITNFIRSGAMIKSPAKLILGLPLLESLQCGGMILSSDQGGLGDGSFGFELSKLQHLSTLHLTGIKGIDKHWCLYNWPKTITNLTVDWCDNLSPSSAHQIIHHIAPRLKNLGLSFKQSDDSWESNTGWNPGHLFSLPSLTDLQLHTWNRHLLDSFRDCESLGCLEWTYITLEDCRTLSGILSRATWPQLKRLVVNPSLFFPRDAPDAQDQAIRDELDSMEDYCKQANIEAFVHQPLRYSNTL